MSNYVISISREFGSGGRLIGKQLAARLGIPCYDRTLILKTAEKSGLSPDFIARAEERARSRFHMSIAPIGIGAPTMSSHGIPVSHQAFFAQSDVIRELAGSLRHRGPVQRLCPGRPGKLPEGVHPRRPAQPGAPVRGGVSHPPGRHGAPGGADGPGPGQLL